MINIYISNSQINLLELICTQTKLELIFKILFLRDLIFNM